MDLVTGVIFAVIIGALGSALFALCALILRIIRKRRAKPPDSEPSVESIKETTAEDDPTTDQEPPLPIDLPEDKPVVFISYSHKDEEWKDRLRPHLEMLELEDRIRIWDDRKINPGRDWFDEIKGIMDRAAVSVCLISADYLASNFCTKEEIPYLLERRKDAGMELILILLRPCAWKTVSWLKALQMLPRDGKCVSRDFKGNEDEVFAEVAERIFDIIDNPDYQPPESPPPEWNAPEKIDIERLPPTGLDLFGRQKEMEMLDKAWESEDTNIVSLVAYGGVGKSTLVNRWLEEMCEDNYRGARRVYGWSFYSQGTGERVTSADQFIAEALTWFGDPDPTAGSPWNKGERLAELVRKERTLLILDGMEPLQSSLPYERGKVKDAALGVLLSELAHENQGLCLISTRLDVADLADFPETTHQTDLEQISDTSGRALLRMSGVRGTDAELEEASRKFGNHALALNLLAAYLHDIPEHRISHASEIPDIDIPVEKGKHPRRVMAAFAQRFGDGAEVEVLQVLGLFDRPANSDAIKAVRAEPAIPGLTELIHGMPDADWLSLLEKLRECRLIAPRSTHNPGVLDAHPLVREHFGEKLRESNPKAWREAHSRLYEYYRDLPEKHQPDTLDEMMPLFAAVAHGCQAGRYQEALDEVYYQRVQRDGKTNYCFSQLGAVGAELAALSGFFNPTWRQPVDGLTENAKASVLNWAGFRLWALGRLAKATEPMQAALKAIIERKDWENAARGASSLSELHLTMGEVEKALDYGWQSVDSADRSGDAFTRMAMRTTLADAVHQAGNIEEAQAAFREAEKMQKERQPLYALLYSQGGFRYCGLLLGRGKYQDVLDRAGQTIHWESGRLLDIALDHLSLGRAHMLLAQAETGDFSQAYAQLDQAVDGLRDAARQDYIPLGLLARAELHRVMGNTKKAQHDLDEAMTIATRGGMRLHEADCYLGFARLYLAMDNKDKARESLATARAMIDEMGYHRRDGEVEKLEAMM